jgi:dCMP deaminase
VNGHCARSTHAEQNALVQAARHGISIEGATLYCTNNPCLNCTKLLINAGITRVVYEESYDDPLAFELLAEANIAIERFDAVTG